MRLAKSVPLRRTIDLLVIGAATLSTGLATLVHDALNRSSARRFLGHHVAGVAEVVADSSSAALAFHDPDAAQAMLRALGSDPMILGAEIVTPDGVLFASWVPAHAGPPSPAAEIDVSRDIVLDGQILGTLRVRSSSAEIDAESRHSMLLALAAGAAALLTTILLVQRLQPLAWRPLTDLARLARDIAQGRNYSLRAPRHGHDDLGDVVDSFNTMLDRIQERDRMLQAQRDALEDEVRLRTADLRRLADDLLVARDRAEEGSRLKTQFIANMSHELRTPMNGVIGMTSVLLDSPLDAPQREQVEIVRTCGEQLLEVIEGILDFSKLEAGRLDLEPAACGMRGLLDATLRPLQAQARIKGVRMDWTVDEAVPDALEGDAMRLRQVLTNLAGNALKFTQRGSVDVRLRALRIEGEDAELEWSVRDTGIGIAKQKLALIFEPFTQADGSTTRRFGGTGLGLTISAQLAERMGGRITVESEEGVGSTFRFVATLRRPATPPDDEETRMRQQANATRATPLPSAATDAALPEAAPPLDDARLRELEEMQPGLVELMARELSRHAPALVNALETAVRAGETAASIEAIHALRGTLLHFVAARDLGFMDAAERRMRSVGACMTPAEIPRVRELVASVDAALARRLGVGA